MSQPKEQRRKQIFAAGAQLFAEQGYERTSLQQVADRLGVTKPALYYYYRSKEELLFQITCFVMDRVQDEILEVTRSDLPHAEQLRELVHRYVRFFAAHPHELTIMSTQVDSLASAHRAQVLARQREYLALVRSIVRPLLAEHPDRQLDETAAAFALLGGMNWIFKWYDPAGPLGPDQLAEQFCQVFLHGLIPTTAP